MSDALSTILLELYRVARGVPSPDFKDAALNVIKAELPFKSAGWGTFVISPLGARVQSVHTHELSMQMMADYETVKQYDTLSAKALSRPGTTINVSVNDTKWKLHPAMLAHVRKWGLDHSLGTIFIDPALNLCTAVSLYRGASGKPFTDRERKLKQQIMMHLVEAWNLNALLYVDRPANQSDTPGRARALIDREGTIYNADAGLPALMHAEFPGWTGPQIPPSVAQPLLGINGESFRGDAIVASRTRVLDDGLSLISVRPLAGIDRLSARERVVAREFASGKTHKEIAHELGISPATVRNQLQAAYQKLGVSTKIELAQELSDSV